MLPDQTQAPGSAYGAASAAVAPAAAPVKPPADPAAPATPEREIDPQEKALVKQWLEKVQTARNHYKDDFKRMRDDMDYARNGADEKWIKALNYTVAIVPRMISLAVAGLYARDPTFSAEPSKRLILPPPLDDPAAVQAAMATPNDPKSQQILQLLMQARQEKVALRRFAQTVEILAAHFIAKARPLFKRQMKALVRRVKTVGVGYFKLDFQRAYTPRPEITQQASDNMRAIERLKFLKEQMAEGEDYGSVDAQLAEAQMLQESLQADPGMITDEGPVFDFPRANTVIPDMNCTSLDGFVGCDWIAVEYNWDTCRAEEQFGVDLKNTTESDSQPRKRKQLGNDPNSDKVKSGNTRFWEVQDRVTRTVFFVAEGYEGFLQAPQPPAVKLDRFWTVFALMFNETEHDDKIFPISDVNALKPTQNEYNSARQALSDHRIAGAPRYVTSKGAFTEEDKKAIVRATPFSVTEVTPPLSGRISDSIEQLKLAPIDPQLYDTEHLFTDALRMTGAQQANFGPVTGSSATEASIADNTRAADVSSQTDDLDDFLSEIGGCIGEVLMANLSEGTVQDIVGPGAVWSEFAMSELQKHVYLATKAGSSGRPNRAAELAALEKAMVWLQNMPSVSEEPILRKAADLLDIDYDELYLASAPSIAAQNAAANGLGNGGANDPRMQGAQGWDTVPSPSAAAASHPTHPAPVATAA